MRIMKRLVCLIVGGLCAWASAASAETELKIVTAKGYVAFVAGDDWPVQQMQTKMPVAMAVFQVPNPADEGTPDSTNLIVQFFEHGSEQEKTVYAAAVKQYGSTAPVVESFKGWTLHRQEALQDETLYSIWDAKRGDIADVSTSVRLAWPHLASNSADYAAQMERIFTTFLDSVWGGLGEYKPREGEVLRRSEKSPQ